MAKETTKKDITDRYGFKPGEETIDQWATREANHRANSPKPEPAPIDFSPEAAKLSAARVKAYDAQQAKLREKSEEEASAKLTEELAVNPFRVAASQVTDPRVKAHMERLAIDRDTQNSQKQERDNARTKLRESPRYANSLAAISNYLDLGANADGPTYDKLVELKASLEVAETTEDLDTFWREGVIVFDSVLKQYDGARVMASTEARERTDTAAKLAADTAALRKVTDKAD